MQTQFGVDSDDSTILLVEDNPDDADLTIDAFRRNHILNEVVVARDGDTSTITMTADYRGDPKEFAVVSEIDGVVSYGKDTKGKRKIEVTPEVGEPREYLIPKGKHIQVHPGDRVRIGDSEFTYYDR